MIVFSAIYIAGITNLRAQMLIRTSDGKLAKITTGESSVFLTAAKDPEYPEVRNLLVSGVPVTGITNTVTYVFYDPQSRSQDHTDIEWSLSPGADGSAAVTAGSGPNYTVQAGDAGKYLYALATPYAADGSGGTVAGQTVKTTPLKVRETYYENPYLGNGWNQMNIYVVDISYNGEESVSGDEIAVYDGSICCAHYTLTGAVDEGTGSSYITLSASQVDQGSDGYTSGDAITIRFWRRNSPLEDYIATLEFADPATGDPVSPPVFTPATSAFVKVSVTSN